MDSGCYNFTQLIDASLQPVLTGFNVLYMNNFPMISGMQPIYSYQQASLSLGRTGV